MKDVRCLPNKFSCKPKEWLLEVVVGFGRDLEVLQVLLPMEGNSRSFDFSFLEDG